MYRFPKFNLFIIAIIIIIFMRLIKENKKFFFFAMLFSFAVTVNAQPSIQGTISKSGLVNTAEIWFKANHNSVAGEYLNYFQLSVAIPAAGNAAVNATAVAINNFQDMGTLTLDGPYIEGAEKIFNFTFLNPAPPTVNNYSWINGVDFIGVRVTFSGGAGNTAQVKLVDFTNDGGGINTNTFFGMISNVEDKTNYANLFYPIPGLSVLGNYGNGDQYAQTVDFVILPVTLLEFSGYKDGSRNQLRWSTAGEQNNRGFEIQRSFDQVSYESLGFVNSAAPGGNSSSRLNYSFTDNSIIGLQQFYRLKVTDRNGASKYSNLVMLRRDKPLSLSVDEIYPNPALSMINLRINAAVSGPLSIVITDMLGEKLFERNTTAVTGYNLFPVMVDNLPAGMYIIRVLAKDGETTKKFVKK